MYITATQLKLNLGMYLSIAQRETVYVTHKGKSIVEISALKNKGSVVSELTGVIPDDGITVKAARAERRRRNYEGGV
ncbi:MAG: type II toxin-antitoxin system prevent-host-death family antitoxin [Oscillospiraceae bacterium]|jgi:hypothetical protein|nr:type II toxin-antitoxin system prevent-host-death family antitoxin [Oscillospiraceae bacterium]